MNIPPYRVRLCHVVVGSVKEVRVTKIPCGNETQARNVADNFVIGSMLDGAKLSQVDVDKFGQHDVWHLISRRAK